MKIKSTAIVQNVFIALMFGFFYGSYSGFRAGDVPKGLLWLGISIFMIGNVLNPNIFLRVATKSPKQVPTVVRHVRGRLPFYCFRLGNVLALVAITCFIIEHV